MMLHPLADINYDLVSKSYGSDKFVCLKCKTFYNWGYEQETHSRDRHLNKYDEAFSKPKKLKKMGDKYLTPHDVWREKYKAEHGEYPIEAYG